MPLGNNKQESDHGSILNLVFNLVPVAWLVLVFAGYALLVFVPPPRPSAEVPGLADLERAVLPLLAFLSLIAIIRYFSLRKQGHTGRPEGRETP